MTAWETEEDTRMDLELNGRVALVTGGANGVGREIALALAAEGAAVAVNYRSSETEARAVVGEIEARGGKAIACAADVADLGQVEAMVARVAGELGGLDILVNNAGLAIRQRFAETTPQEWRGQIDTCLYGAIHCCHAAAPHLEKSGAGRIVCLIGDSSRVGESGLSIVAAARAGVIGLVKSLAREYGRFGATANVLSLGLIETAHDRAWVDANRDKLVRLYPLRRLGQPEDVAPMVALLASKHGGWITGQVISISGGFSMV
jgi:NAD(P)-dependent dehydrogenase (short-subunit alcohol dehydrogenase family)